jgi:prepilin-type processing-associated H-X9-DG protein
MLAAAKAGDPDAFLACLAKETRDRFAALKKVSKEVAAKDTKPSEDAENTIKAMMGSVKGVKDPAFGEAKINGDIASMDVMDGGETARVTFVKEGSGWKVSIPQFTAMLDPGLVRPREEVRRIRDRNNLNQLAKGMAIYLIEYGDNRFYPAGLGELFDKKVVPDVEVFVSPLDNDPPKLANGLKCSYVSCFDKYPDREFRDDFPPNIMMAWDRIAFVQGNRNVLFFDGHAESVDEARFEQLLKELDAQVKDMKPRRPH